MMCVLHSFSIKNSFYDKIALRLFYFRVKKCISHHYKYIGDIQSPCLGNFALKNHCPEQVCS